MASCDLKCDHPSMDVPQEVTRTKVRGAERFEVEGMVQGVGFRPFVYRVATEYGLDGFVGNDSARVFVEVTGPAEAIERFASRLINDAPPLAKIDRLRRSRCEPSNSSGFRIVESRSVVGPRTLIPPDVAACDACVSDLFDEKNRRFGHPFVTCTNCGPRFTIIESLPYDRPATTMAGFEMCLACRSEYENPADRRYHAQPISCHDCGPVLTFVSSEDSPAVEGSIEATVRALKNGDTVAIKGLGGYHLACDATSDEAVVRLRDRKQRPDKPFAIMVRDLAHARQFADISAIEGALLESAAAPVVLLSARKGSELSSFVAPANPLVGIMVAYTPLHHLLFECHDGPLVMTSANRVSEPLAYSAAAIASLDDLYDGLLDHDREILVPCDDSVVRVVAGKPMPVRRARGYAPIPVVLPNTETAVLAVGAELKNTFCVAAEGYAWVSQHLGDMENLETLESFESSIARFLAMYDVEPSVVAVDRHPGYFSSTWGRKQPFAVEEVQHHHAHVAAIMAEHGLDPTEQVIGFAFDGTGFGDDGSIWGGEVLVADAFGFRRVAHLAPFSLPGGDAAVRNPYRTALALLHGAGVSWADEIASVRTADSNEQNLLQQMLSGGFGVSQTSSMGRLFDGVASLIGLRHRASFEAQAAIDLEFAASSLRGSPGGQYRFELDGEQARWQPVIQAVTRDVLDGADEAVIAFKFHEAVADLVHRLATRCRLDAENHGQQQSTIALSGGVFQNALLVQLCCDRLAADEFTVLTHEVVPPNDGGLALGQAFIAAHRATQRARPVDLTPETS